MRSKKLLAWRLRLMIDHSSGTSLRPTGNADKPIASMASRHPAARV